MMALFAPAATANGALDQIFARLHEHLDSDIVRHVAVLDEKADEGELRVRRGREADLDFLEAHFTNVSNIRSLRS